MRPPSPRPGAQEAPSSSSGSSDAIAAAACAALESGALQLANHPTVGLYFVRDHVRSSLPSALATARFLEEQVVENTKRASHDAGAASEAVEVLRGAAPGAVGRMEAALEAAAASLEAIEGGSGNSVFSSSSSSSSPPPPPPPPKGAGPGALLSSLYEAATGGGGSKKQ